MDFFERQDRARRRTWLLVVYLLAAIGAIMLALNVVAYLVAVYGGAVEPGLHAWLERPWWAIVCAAVLAIVLIGSLVRFIGLRGGGRAVAEMVGARPIDPSSGDPLERRLVNVVEEMSIASGTPVPELYVMDHEQGINAFVAGYRPTGAVMVVTRGALEALDRDQLQGVVGHEYSHILNGDMRLNVRLIAILAGILAIGVVGRVMLRSVSGGRRRVSSSRNGKGTAVVVIAGLAMLILGYIGLFFGRLIKAAVSRQREFLADASSVQFTRNPEGIAGALWRIREHQYGSLLEGDHTEDTSHMCFGQSMKMGLASLMATHPPIDERIAAIDPHFAGKMAATRVRERQQGAAAAASPAAVPAGAAGFAGSMSRDAEVAVSPVEMVGSVGTVRPEHVDYAAALHAAVPDGVMRAVHGPGTAACVILGLLLCDLDEDRVELGAALIRHRADAATADAALEHYRDLRQLDVRFLLPVAELALPSLKRLADGGREQLLDTAEKLARVDRQVSVFEFVVLTILRKHLSREAERPDRIRHFKFESARTEIRKLLTLVANAGARDDPEEARTAFAHGAQSFGQSGWDPVSPDECDPAQMPGVLEELAALSPMLKRPLLEACVDCVLHDGKVTVAEGELVRAIAATLDCPMPPLAPAA